MCGQSAVIDRTDIDGVVEIRPRIFADERGHFIETWQHRRYEDAGIDTVWVQDNQSLSLQPGTIRGLHLQLAPFGQAKLVRVCAGSIFDVAVDLRYGSPTYGRWVGRELSAERGNQLFIPDGFAHGFVTLAADTVVAYKVSAPYTPTAERSILWNDPALAIDWPLHGEPKLSAKDAAAAALVGLVAELGQEGIRPA
jgi:dTDP-4-dehydrorhamnose 3,5-epimerase